MLNGKNTRSSCKVVFTGLDMPTLQEKAARRYPEDARRLDTMPALWAKSLQAEIKRKKAG